MTKTGKNKIAENFQDDDDDEDNDDDDDDDADRKITTEITPR